MVATFRTDCRGNRNFFEFIISVFSVISVVNTSFTRGENET
jgi:hypothetical protein